MSVAWSRDGHGVVGVHDVVDERDVLVADALDVVVAVPVVEHGRAFEGFHGHDPGAVTLLEVVARPERAARARGRHVGGQIAATGRFEDVLECPARHPIVGEVIGEFGELIEDHVRRVFGQFIAGVVDLFDIGLDTEGLDDVLWS